MARFGQHCNAPKLTRFAASNVEPSEGETRICKFCNRYWSEVFLDYSNGEGAEWKPWATPGCEQKYTCERKKKLKVNPNSNRRAEGVEEEHGCPTCCSCILCMARVEDSLASLKRNGTCVKGLGLNQ